MFLIMPESCYTPTNIKEVAPAMKFYSWILFKADRGGKKKRDYNSAVYSLEDRDAKRVNVTNEDVPENNYFISTVKYS